MVMSELTYLILFCQITPEVHKWAFLRMRSKNMAKIALNAVRLPKFEPVIVVAEKDHDKRFTATFRSDVILRMRRELRGL